MDDLIRREDAMQRFSDEVKQSRKDHIHINTIKRLLDDVDVAYNVDKVVEQIKTHNYSDGIGWLALKFFHKLKQFAPAHDKKYFDVVEQALEEVEQYRALGTVEELKEAREKQIASKWICYDISGRCVCPECESEWDYMDNCVEEFKYCPNCGKRLE